LQPPLERLREMYHRLQYSDKRRNKFFHYMINREFIREEADFPSVQCFRSGFDFLDLNRDADDWFLQIETFDPHEPFFSPKRFREDYPTNYAGPILDWPPYARVNEAPDECAELRANYCAIVAVCDDLVGKLIDYFDKHDLWRTTALIVSTDHGFLLGEHDWWAKNRMPVYEEVSHIPLFMHHPAMPEAAGTRRLALTQTIDLMPTFLDLYGIARPAEVEGRSLLPVLARDQALREAAIFGVFGSATNLTDGRYTYFRYPDDVRDQELYQYTLMPTHLADFFSTEELKPASLAPAFPFTKGVPLLKIPATPKSPMWNGYGPGGLQDTETVLYDLDADPLQVKPIKDADAEARLAQAMARLMRANDAPPEAFRRLRLEPV
jgi:arylsulfatase A-like enzyme